MPIINFDRLPAAMRPQTASSSPAAPTLSIGPFVSVWHFAFRTTHLYGSHGQKWHFHGICGLVMLFVFLRAWYNENLMREPAFSAIWAGIMCEFFAYIALNKILSVAEEHQIEELVNETANKSMIDVNDQI
ncbi:hypothetical protein niasHS_000214 [Heterodera schachtii]|uniref:Uncharacterized protein n=1 Tax=Heterodera schachtii TaxID=97005 RepID=A0ABD2KBS3_HETSC